MSLTYVVGDSLTVLATLPDASVDLVLSSPPYLALRSYLPSDHPDKAAEMGSEPTPGAFIDALLDITEECRRVLAPHGTLAFELGDTFAGSGGAGGDYNEGGLRDDAPKFSGSALSYRRTAQRNREGGGAGGDWPLDRSLCMIPELYRFALAYGFNPLTGRQTPRWRVRNVVRHFRPNPPVGALGGKYRPATSDWCIAMPGVRRYFDADCVRTKPVSGEAGAVVGTNGSGFRGITEGGPRAVVTISDPAGAPPLDWWADDDLEWRDAAGFVAPTAPYAGAHFATFSPKVIARLIDPMCPRQVCTVCGVASERIAVTTNAVGTAVGRKAWIADSATSALMHSGPILISANDQSVPDRAERETIGWTDCDCPGDHYRPGVVLDPFAGSGTTLLVAHGHGRSAIGIDIDARNLELCRERLGPMVASGLATELGVPA